MTSIDENLGLLRKKIERLPGVSARPMFGYHCYSAKGKFFVGFSRKDRASVIIRLSKVLQNRALQSSGSSIRPFSHGAKMGWIELDAGKMKLDDAYRWVREGYRYAIRLVSSSEEKG